MQREIKFRAWNSDNKLIVGEHLMCYNKDGIIQIAGVSIDESNEECDEDVLIEQFTGLKDKNGKEYYFNDIVEFKDGSKGVLVWFDDKLGIASGQINNYHAIDEVSKQELLESKIIGNIHENPELI